MVFDFFADERVARAIEDYLRQMKERGTRSVTLTPRNFPQPGGKFLKIEPVISDSTGGSGMIRLRLSFLDQYGREISARST